MPLILHAITIQNLKGSVEDVLTLFKKMEAQDQDQEEEVMCISLMFIG
ncbi:hypothetical protein A2U01_0000285 [Trifolium medium]|uniref:Uncharacterized protein n=1 Tax=Trifolium medium TaxID=97028 RepID=A0A392LY17_9FABA|nr:hypothetical protein [Trifolium medium]